MKKVLLIFGGLIILVYVLLATSPIIIKKYFNAHSEELIGRKAGIESLTFNPFQGRLRVENFTVYEKEDSTEFSGFGSLDADIYFLKLLTGAVEFEHIYLDSPYVHTIKDYDTFNFSDLIPESEEDSLASEEEESEFAFEIYDFVLSKGLVTYYDKEMDHMVEMEDLSLALPHFGYDSESADMEVELMLNQTGKLKLENNYFPKTNKLIAHVSMEGIDLDLIEPYLKPYLNFTEFSGHAGGNINITGDFSDLPELLLDGQVWAADLSLLDSAAIPAMKADSIYASLAKIDVLKQSYQVSRVLADGIHIRFDMLDSTNSMIAMFQPLLEEEDSAAVVTDSVQSIADQSDLFYSLDTFMIINSSVLYRDYTFEDYFEYNISAITATSEKIRSDSELAVISSTGLLNEKGKYNANVSVNPQNPLDFSIDFAVKGFQMGDLSPFSLMYAGHPIFEGELIYSGKTTVLDGKMESQNKFTINNLEVGDRVSKNVLYALPLKFGVFLMKDKNGVVNLDVPVEGSLYDPQFAVWPIVWQVVKQNLDKVVSAPGKLLASVFGVKEKDIQYIEFQPLDTLVGASQEKSVQQLIELMQKKSGLTVDLEYYVPDNIEVKALAMREAKVKYMKAQLNKELSSSQVPEIADNDVHFISYMKSTLAIQQPSLDSASLEVGSDSLAMLLVDQQHLLSQALSIEETRTQELTQAFAEKDSALASSVHVKKLEEIPEFPVTSSGFVVKFGVK